MEKKTAHIISHSHWDREWYMSLEEHRYYLVKLFDDLLEQLAIDPDFHSFHLDGQTIMVDDYLQVRPQKEAEVKKYIREGRLIIGPWYILQDAFLTSAEANIRNLLYGMKDTKKLGQEGTLGYFPDTFGIYGQAPQILKQAKIDVAAFGRGVTPTGFNNQVHHSDDFSSPYSEMMWEAPDGSKVLGILFANWYSNGNEIPAEKEAAAAFWQKKLTDVEKFASTSQLLFMNGCDHQPLQKDVIKAIDLANELMPNVTFKHSSFNEYIAELKQELPKELQTIIKGELRNQKTDGWSTLVNTASARIYLKQANDRCQTLLERVLEPMGLMAPDKDLHRDFTEFYWKMLMENHPHDSICGCSVDEVHREMETRFEKVEKGAKRYIEEQAREIAATLPTSHQNPDAVPLVLFHASGKACGKVIKTNVFVHKIYFDEMNFQDIPEALKKIDLPSYFVERPDGSIHQAHVKEIGTTFGYDLPKDGFRKPYYAKEIEVNFWLETDIQVGFEVCHLVPGERTFSEGNPIWQASAKKLENEHLSVSIHEDGTYCIKDKNTGLAYNHLGSYEDTGDIGNEYMYKASGDGKTLSTKNSSSSIEVIENTAFRASILLSTTFSVPKQADDQLKLERENLVWHPERTAGRHQESAELKIQTVLVLEKGSKGLEVKVNINNQAKDHRLRALFPAGSGNSHHYADSIFEIVKRPNQPENQWSNPSFDHHMQRFVSLNDSNQGLTVAGKGLHEYEILDGKTIAVTLLRSVGELGDWGVFETPEAQCIGEQRAEFFLIPHKGDVISSEAYNLAYDYPLETVVIQTAQSAGEGDQAANLLNWSGSALSLTTCKPAEEGNGMIVRWFNPGEKVQELTVQGTENKAIYLSTILEDKEEHMGSGAVKMNVQPHQIITLLFEQ
ncbi:alpha-mannosidase [Jeotgalibacillus proteolyticus]|uniref:Alpha-mannosidase n=1 Tax=Jeotgalibacillus proteolyticus TaxID=2082395 RepID=A0A2S5GBY6_9BACL|nr:alpha-mannosidase [Jeotgalibacillus proteolyticus]PPA70468.1 alpha-mannosidase [Jeotgalibacillus proteolyticus]